MIKKTIEYTDYNGNKKTEEAWFHLNRPECYKIMLSEDCDLEAYMVRFHCRTAQRVYDVWFPYLHRWW